MTKKRLNHLFIRAWENRMKTAAAVLSGILALYLLISCAGKVKPVKPVVGARQIGIASWYGEDFHGKPTASGEIYNMYDMTAAHQTLPLGTHVMVTNLDTGKSVQVKINDRGPFVKNRIIDLSYSAARAIGMVGPGTARVALEVLDTPGSPRGHSVARVSPEEPALYTIQVASFVNKENADMLAVKIENLVEGVYIVLYRTHETTYYRVRVGTFDSREKAVKTAKRLTGHGYNVIITSYE